MALYKAYPAHIILLRRAFAVVAGVAALPVMLFWKDRARYYSWLHRVWSKTSEQPCGWRRRRKPLTISINPPAAKKITRPPGCPGGFFSPLVYTRFYAPPWNWQVRILPERAIFCRLRS